MDAVGSIMGGYSQAQQYTTQAALATQQAKDVSIQATQTSEQRREQLNSSLANVSANRAEGNLSPDSPTAMAIQGAITNASTRTQGINRLGFLNQEQSLQWQSSALTGASKNAITAGWVNGITTSVKNDVTAYMGA